MRCLGVVIMFFLLVGSSAGQDLSSLVLPSEDELLEALREGEIDFEQYLLLQEYFAFGIAPWESYLFDEIPNLSLRRASDTLSELEADQVRPFRDMPVSHAGLSGQIIHRAGIETEGDKRTRYRSSVRLSLDDTWFLRGQIQREYTGRERVTQRTIEYRKKGNDIDRVVLGSFSEQFGLGTVIGRRGKLVNFDSRLSNESWLYPDYGGYNGILAQGDSRKIEWKGLVSHVRDTAFSVSTAAGMMTFGDGKLRPSLIIGTTRLFSRANDHTMTLHSMGLNLRMARRSGAIEAEVVGQTGDGPSSLSGIVEGRADGTWGDMRFSGWIYSDSYRDITSGSRAARIYRNCRDGETDFSYTSRRCGQSGAIGKYTTEPLPGYALSLGLAYGAFNPDTSLLEMSAGITRHLSKKLALGAAVEERLNRKFQADTNDENDRRKTRIEVRYTDKWLRMRGYVGYATQTDTRDYWTLFWSGRLEGKNLGDVEIWSNFGRIEHLSLSYWYGFVRYDQELIDHFSVGVKLAQSYRRTDVPRRNTTIVLEAASRF